MCRAFMFMLCLRNACCADSADQPLCMRACSVPILAPQPLSSLESSIHVAQKKKAKEQSLDIQRSRHRHRHSLTDSRALAAFWTSCLRALVTLFPLLFIVQQSLLIRVSSPQIPLSELWSSGSALPPPFLASRHRAGAGGWNVRMLCMLCTAYYKHNGHGHGHEPGDWIGSGKQTMPLEAVPQAHPSIPWNLGQQPLPPDQLSSVSLLSRCPKNKLCIRPFSARHSMADRVRHMFGARRHCVISQFQALGRPDLHHPRSFSRIVVECLGVPWRTWAASY